MRKPTIPQLYRTALPIRILRETLRCLVAIALLSSRATASELPSGTHIEIRLLKATGSRVSHRGDRVQAVVIAPVIVSGTPVIPQGSLLSGSVLAVHPLGLGLRHCTASLELLFDSLQSPNQDPVAISARVLEVETAKERVTSKGVIGGIHPAVNLSSGVSLFVSAVLMNPAISVPALGVKFLIARSPDPEIYFPPGTEMIIRTIDTVETPALFAGGDTARRLSPTDEANARQLLSTVPQQQTERKPNQPSDLANVLLLGERDQIDRAFRAAGWTGASRHNAMAVYRMFHCVVQRAGYSMAPMTRLKLNGVAQQADYQKSLDTFAKRHHIRLWRQDGTDAWLSAASEDVSFNVNKMLISHASDVNIDNERAKVVNDLAMTGCVASASLIPRNDLRVESDGTQSIVTDGKIAVLRLSDCRQPQDAVAAQHYKVPSKSVRIALAVARDVARSNPVSLVFYASNMMMNREDAKPRAASQNAPGGSRKGLPSQTLLSNYWRRPSVVDSPTAVATTFSLGGDR